MNSIFVPVIITSLLVILLGILIGIINFLFKYKNNPIIDKLNLLLPQYNCGHCNYPSCLLYAESIIQKKENINKCVPGGKEVILNISKLLNRKNTKIKKNKKLYYETAFIEEKNCIGCTKCSKICPIDAIVGSENTIHTVLQEICTGCKLCISPCPTDCISIIKTNFDSIN